MSVRASTTSPGRQRQERARQQARREILEAAAGVFARRGYDASTLADLAQAAGYAAPSLYRYFVSKEEIFRSLVELVKADLRATFDAPVRAADTLVERLEALLTRQIALGRDRRDVVALVLSTPPSALGGTHPLAELRAGMTLYEAHFAEWLRRHATQGELRGTFAEAARVLAAIGHAFHHAHLLDPAPGIDIAAEAHRVVDLALHGIAATPARGHVAARRGATT
jgi:AcrR family transcriptional regulator